MQYWHSVFLLYVYSPPMHKRMQLHVIITRADTYQLTYVTSVMCQCWYM